LFICKPPANSPNYRQARPGDWPSGTGFYINGRVNIRQNKSQGNAMTNFRMAVLGLAAAAALAGSQALAAGAGMPLAPGKPAGVQEAQRHHRNLLLIGGISVLVVAGIVYAATNSGSSNCPPANCPTTTATTSTS
jgi:hypothetical protein